ncbi:neuropilin and tolloid-like isoform X2 [Choristoneura fumiferana]|uniref:neuropilin and tolloid-like isoform X2 n=1 Tax=Choristoneura fumiferana TaxID=7141 RepID=UPI003D15F24F
MTTLAVLCLALVCSFGAATEADHGSILIADELFEDAATTMSRTNSNHRLDNENKVTSVVNKYLRLNNGNTTRQYKGNENENVNKKVRSKRNTGDPRCAPFEYTGPSMTFLNPPVNKEGDKTYANNVTCITKISAPNEKQVVTLTFVDIFEIEDHPKCEYDYLEVRDGKYGFENILEHRCGKAFPPQITSTGPHIWLKFKSDDNIEYAGFRINIAFTTGSDSQTIPDSCFIPVAAARYGKIDNNAESVKKCRDESPYSLNIIWKITTEQGSKINLDFENYNLKYPNECELNLVQVFGSEPNFDHKLAYYCGLVANQVTTKDDIGNVMYVRMFAAKSARDKSKLIANYISVRTLEGQGCKSDEFDCADGTCIDLALRCNEVAECRLKADEDVELCKKKKESPLSEPHIQVILIIFSLILSGMCFVFLFKCIRKLYQDHKIIKEHIQRSCEDRLDTLMDGELTLDPKQLERDSEPRASLERENHTNEMYKQQRNNRKASSIDSDYIHDTQIDIDDDMWRREAESIPVDPEDIRIENKGRMKRSDTSKREESLRSKSAKEEDKEKRDIRDASVGAPDTKESGCQTRESLFQVEPAQSSDGSGTNSRGFSTFGYSGATIARPSPAPANTSEITIELLRQVTPQESIKSQKKMDRRPMSSETTRSAPDVIIVSKPIR